MTPTPTSGVGAIGARARDGAPTGARPSGALVSGPSSDAASSTAGASPWVMSTYFAEGLPYSIVHQISSQFFTALGASLPAIGLTSLYGLAWNLKFIWSPIVDRYSTTRRWLVGTQLAIALVVFAIAWPASLGDQGAVARMMVALAFLAATHDIAIDGYYLRALGTRQQTALSGMRIASYRVALLVGNGVLVWLAGRTSWFWCFMVAGGLMLLLTIAHAAFLPAERSPNAGQDPGAKAVDGRTRITSALFTSFFERPRIAPTLAFILTFRAGDAMMFAMSAPLLKDLGMGTAERGVVSGIGTAASIAGSILGSALITRFSLRRTLVPIALVQSLAIPLYVLLAWVRPGPLGIGAVVVAEQLVAGVGTAAFLIFLVRRSAGEYKVSHFAIASALMSVATTAAGSVSGYLASLVGFTAFFAVAFVASIPGVILARSVPTE